MYAQPEDVASTVLLGTSPAGYQELADIINKAELSK